MNLPNAVTSIKTSLSNIDICKPRLAKILWVAKHEFSWKETEYKTWRGFCNVEVALSQSSIYRYLNTYDSWNKLGYSDIDVYGIVNSIGWSRFQLGVSTLVSNLPVKEFIERFKDANLNERVVFGESDSDLVPFSFSLPAHTAELLTNELVVRGMRVNNHNRTNASAAMVKLVSELAKE